ncbi:MAG TPA: hypothetical protein DCZ94_13715 [Lentisphaeria bacterium]|nr:MAG: hypothetical protein A2X48_11290 [Lentisphaerae bacterium GWF2_49_21]HBC88003.1 hypothetical protein [Lentisphaeria bacterium]
MGEEKDKVSELKKTLAMDIKRDGMTITQFMEKCGIEGGVALDEKGKSSSVASSVLVDQAGRKYDIGRKVNQGGMGAILQAKDLNIRRTVAMKVLLDPKRSTDNQIIRLIEEAQITGQMEHPGIVPVHELGVDASGNVFYTMKFVKGVTLDSIIDGIRNGVPDIISKYPLNSLLTIFLKICDAMAFSHTKGVVHRDLKPANIMIGEFGEVLVMDWGLGKVIGRKEKDDVSEDATGSRTIVESSRSDGTASVEGAMTMEGKAMGTPVYMPPEQAYGKVSEIDHRSDIYALGAILYDILTLSPPVGGDNVNDILMKVVQGRIETPTLFEHSHKLKLRHLPGGHVPAALSSVAMKALSPDKNDRYQSVKDLQKDIEAYQGGFATSAEGAGLFRQLWLFAGRHKGFVAAAASVFLAVAIGLVVALAQRNQALTAERNAVEAKEEAQNQRDAAEIARNSALKAKTAEELQRVKAEKLQTEDEYESYVARIGAIQMKVQEENLSSAREMIESCQPYFRNWEWGRMKRLCNPKVVVMTGHQAAVTSAAFFPDGKRILSSSSDKTVRIWDSATGKESLKIELDSPVDAVAVSRDGRFLTAEQSGAITM